MKSIIEEIETYQNNVRLAEKTIKNYTTYLKRFVSYLSKEMKKNPIEIYLDKIYLLSDKNGTPIRYLPIDCTIIDNYFLINKGYEL